MEIKEVRRGEIMTKTVIVSAARTPFGKFGGALKELKAAELGGLPLRKL